MGIENLVGRGVNKFVGRYQDRLGIAATRRIAKAYNRLRYGGAQKRHDAAYRDDFSTLLVENDANFDGAPKNTMVDGWAIDRSGSFPFIEEALAQADEIIAARGGKDNRGTPMAQQDFLIDLTAPAHNRVEDMRRYPALLDFALSSEIVATIANYMESVPVLSRTRPPGIRLFESTNRYDQGAGGPFRASQLYHLDMHDQPLIYVILLVRDVLSTSGPWRFFPKSESETASRHLRYQRRGEPYRVTDERIYEAVDMSESVEFTGKRGDVLFIDSSQCFHYGSRDAEPPRYQLMYAFTTHCRSDFTLMVQDPTPYPHRPDDSRLRSMVLCGTL